MLETIYRKKKQNVGDRQKEGIVQKDKLEKDVDLTKIHQ